MSDVVRLRFPESGLDKPWHLQKLLKDIRARREGPWGGGSKHFHSFTRRQSPLQSVSFPESPFQSAKKHNTPCIQNDSKGDGSKRRPKKRGYLDRSCTLILDARKRSVPLGNQPSLCKLV